MKSTKRERFLLSEGMKIWQIIMLIGTCFFGVVVIMRYVFDTHIENIIPWFSVLCLIWQISCWVFSSKVSKQLHEGYHRGSKTTKKTCENIRSLYDNNTAMLSDFAAWWKRNSYKIRKIEISKMLVTGTDKVQSLNNGYHVRMREELNAYDIAYLNSVTEMFSYYGIRSIDYGFSGAALYLEFSFRRDIFAPLKELWFVEKPGSPINVEGVRKQEVLGAEWYLVTISWVSPENDC